MDRNNKIRSEEKWVKWGKYCEEHRFFDDTGSACESPQGNWAFKCLIRARHLTEDLKICEINQSSD